MGVENEFSHPDLQLMSIGQYKKPLQISCGYDFCLMTVSDLDQ